MTARCNWCVGFIRRDCTIMERCVQTGMRRPRRAASAMSTGTAKTPKAVEGRSPASAARQGTPK
jgi:hypothetical protein